MNSDELIFGLRDIIETKDLKDIKDFILILWKSYSDKYEEKQNDDEINNEDELENDDGRENDEFDGDEFFRTIEEKFKIKDINKYLSIIEDYFENKEKYDWGPVRYNEQNPYEIFMPCYYIVSRLKMFYDLFAEKVEDVDFVEQTRWDLRDELNTLISYTTIREEDYENKEEYEKDNKQFMEVASNLKKALYTKISSLSIDDFLLLNFNELDSYYDDLVKEKINEMNEEQLYRYILKTDNNLNYVKQRVEKMNSPALKSLVSNMYYRDFDEKIDKIQYIIELRRKSIRKVEMLVSHFIEKDDLEYPGEKYYIPQWGESDYKRLEQLDEFKLFLEKLSKLNNQEFVMYLANGAINIDELKTVEEKELIEKKVKELSDLDLETALYMVRQNGYTAEIIDKEINNRNLMVDKLEENKFHFQTLKDRDLLDERAKIYNETMQFDYFITVIKPITDEYSYEAEEVFQKTEGSLIRSMCEICKKSDLQIINIISNLNKAENNEEYECVHDYERIFYRNNKKSFHEMIKVYQQRCKYELITYLRKRIFSMPKAYVAMIDTSNANGIFNKTIEMRLDNERIDLTINNSDGIEH